MIATSLGAKGFRPFFLLAAVHAAVAVPLWLAVFTGRVAVRGPLQGVVWHGHEMVFGFTLAVVAGFLLTAVSNWTGRPTLTGAPLLGLAALWLAARLALFAVPGWLGPVLDLCFLPVLAVGIGRPLIATGNRRNLVFLGLLGALWIANLSVYAGVGWQIVDPQRADRVAIYLIAVIIAVVAGRVVPMFTRNATGQSAIGSLPWVDGLAIGATALAAVAQLGMPGAAVVEAVAGLALLARMWTWGTRYTARDPMLWVLHAGHACVGLGLLASGLRPLWVGPASIALHAITVGGIGLLTIGMMARVSLGHTGRVVQANAVIALAFGGVVSAVLLRVVAPVLMPAYTLGWLWAAGLAWTAGFGLLVAVFGPVWLAPRADGKPG